MKNSGIPSQRKATCCAVSAAVMMMGAPLAYAQSQGGDQQVQAASSDGQPIQQIGPSAYS